MADPSNWTETELNGLVTNDVQEDLHLDYKRSEALSNTDGCRNELSKDVAAFANSDGGMIIYAVAEKGHRPEKVDDGVIASELGREWLEQVIVSNIQPKIDGLKIHPIPLVSKGTNRVAYVIEIPRSTSRGPHQSRDKKYYKRYNFQSVPMEDYEIRDILRRASVPDLFIRFSFDHGSSTRLNHSGTETTTQPSLLIAEIGNRSNTPAQHALIKIYFGQWLNLEPMHGLKYGGTITRDGEHFQFYTIEWSVPPRLPIFAETMLPISERMMFSIDGNLIGRGLNYWLGYEIRAPGFTGSEFVRVIEQPRGTLWMPRPPGD